LRIATEWRRLDQGGIDDLRDWCLSVEKPVLIAVDTLKKVRPRKRSGQSDYEADYEACEGLQKLAGDFGISIMIAHHDRKMAADDVFDTMSGTLGLIGGVDAIAMLIRRSSGITLHIGSRASRREREGFALRSRHVPMGNRRRGGRSFAIHRAHQGASRRWLLV
jgi:hypothetical protein